MFNMSGSLGIEGFGGAGFENDFLHTKSMNRDIHAMQNFRHFVSVKGAVRITAQQAGRIS
jgi:hypothetical protein